MPETFEDRRVTVMGLGRFGGGVGVARFLAQHGAQVLVTDQSPPDKLAESLAKLQPLIDTGQVTLRLGEHNVSDFTTCDLVVVNPAVPPGSRFLRAAEAAGVPITTEIRLLVERLPNRLRTIGVTGSAGKSTVTAMIGHVLEKVYSGTGSGVSGLAGTDGSKSTDQLNPDPRPGTRNPRVWVGGNIGGSLLERVDEIGPDDWVVLELSSFMLERLRDQPDAPGYADGRFRGWSPHIAVVTNISENHLDWHGSMAAYIDAKLVLFRYQDQRSDVRVLGPDVRNRFQKVAREGFEGAVTTPIMGFVYGRIRDSLMIPGKHNWHNAMTALHAVSSATGQKMQEIENTLADFPGLPHRLQYVGAFDGVKYYNDSKCTTPEAARLAVEAFAGEEKGVGSLFLDGASAEKTVSDTVSQKTVSDTVSGGEGKDSRPLLGVHLILGGYDKGSDLAPLAGFARANCKAVYTIGETGEGVALAAEAASPRGAAVVRCGTLDKAVSAIRERAVAGDVVLLSPGCASWDQFENYEQRGERFIELVREAYAQ